MGGFYYCIMKASNLCFLCFILFLCGCNPLLRTIYGVKKPKVKSESQIERYLRNKNFTERPNYSFSSEGFRSHFIEDSNSIISLTLFDKKGRLITPNDAEIDNCTGKINTYLDLLPDTNIYVVSDSIFLHEKFNGLTNLSGSPVNINVNDSITYYAVISWATFFGKLNYDVIKWEEQLDSLGRTTPVQIIRVNADIRDFWGVKLIVDFE